MVPPQLELASLGSYQARNKQLLLTNEWRENYHVHIFLNVPADKKWIAWSAWIKPPWSIFNLQSDNDVFKVETDQWEEIKQQEKRQDQKLTWQSKTIPMTTVAAPLAWTNTAPASKHPMLLLRPNTFLQNVYKLFRSDWQQWLWTNPGMVAQGQHGRAVPWEEFKAVPKRISIVGLQYKANMTEKEQGSRGYLLSVYKWTKKLAPPQGWQDVNKDRSFQGK
jgi:hypothetical protein